MNTGAFGEGFPYTNFHDLNMDWIIKIAKDFLDQYTHIQQTIEEGLEGLDNKYNTLQALLDEWYNTHSEDIATQLADALNELNEWYNTHSEDIATELADALSSLNTWYTEHQNYLDETLATNIETFDNHAEQKAEETIASIPDDYTSLSNDVVKLKSEMKRSDYNINNFTLEVSDPATTTSSITERTDGICEWVTDFQTGSYCYLYASLGEFSEIFKIPHNIHLLADRSFDVDFDIMLGLLPNWGPSSEPKTIANLHAIHGEEYTINFTPSDYYGENYQHTGDLFIMVTNNSRTGSSRTTTTKLNISRSPNSVNSAGYSQRSQTSMHAIDTIPSKRVFPDVLNTPPSVANIQFTKDTILDMESVSFNVGDVNTDIINIGLNDDKPIGIVYSLQQKRVMVHIIDEDNALTNNINGYSIVFTENINTNWGIPLVSIPLKDGLTITDPMEYGSSGLSLDTPIYAILCNQRDYSSQSTKSLHIKIAISIVSKDYMEEVGLVFAQYAKEVDPAKYYSKAQLNEILGIPGYITCWGDSLTALGGWTNVLHERSGLTLYNAGIAQDTSISIESRQGGDAMIVNNITIPADNTTPIVVALNANGGFDTELGYKAEPFKNHEAVSGEHCVNPVNIGDIIGTLTYIGTDYFDPNGRYEFTRTTSGTAVTIDRPTVLKTAYDRDKNNPYLMVIFMGTNGGYDTIDELIAQHKRMIEHSNAKHTIILGITTGNNTSRATYESKMKEAFGRYYISLREYLVHPIYNGGQIVSCYGMADQNVAVDPNFIYDGKTTIQEIEEGIVPHQILHDAIHYTSGTQTVIGNLIYKRCKELNIF